MYTVTNGYWCIARVDLFTRTTGTQLGGHGLWSLAWADRMRDLPTFAAVRAQYPSARDADLVMLRPDGTVKLVDAVSGS